MQLGVIWIDAPVLLDANKFLKKGFVMKKSNHKKFDWYNACQRFSIRKYHFGAASVLLGTALVLALGAQTAQAEEQLAEQKAEGLQSKNTVADSSQGSTTPSSQVYQAPASVNESTVTPTAPATVDAPVKVDKSALNVAIIKAKKASLSDKTDASIQSFKQALANAEAILSNAQASQETVAEAVKSLTKAQDDLSDNPAVKPNLDLSAQAAPSIAAEKKTELTELRAVADAVEKIEEAQAKAIDYTVVYLDKQTGLEVWREKKSYTPVTKEIELDKNATIAVKPDISAIKELAGYRIEGEQEKTLTLSPSKDNVIDFAVATVGKKRGVRETGSTSSQSGTLRRSYINYRTGGTILEPKVSHGLKGESVNIDYEEDSTVAAILEKGYRLEGIDGYPSSGVFTYSDGEQHIVYKFSDIQDPVVNIASFTGFVGERIVNAVATITDNSTSETDSTGRPLSGTVSSHVEGLPAGLTYDPVTKTISGTPEVTGAFYAEFVATDASGNSIRKSFSVTVSDRAEIDLAAARKDARKAIDQAAADAKKAIEAHPNLSADEKEAALSRLRGDAALYKIKTRSRQTPAEVQAVEDAGKKVIAYLALEAAKRDARKAIDQAVAEAAKEINAHPSLDALDAAAKKIALDKVAAEEAKAKQAIYAQTTDAAVQVEENKGVDAIKAVQVEAAKKDAGKAIDQAVADADKAIDQAAADAKKAIEAQPNLSADEKKAEQAKVDAAATAAKGEIAKATDSAQAQAAEDAGKKAIADIALAAAKTDADKKADADKAIDQAAADAKKAIEALPNLSAVEKRIAQARVGLAATLAKNKNRGTRTPAQAQAAGDEGKKAIADIALAAAKDDADKAKVSNSSKIADVTQAVTSARRTNQAIIERAAAIDSANENLRQQNRKDLEKKVVNELPNTGAIEESSLATLGIMGLLGGLGLAVRKRKED